jgi:hypothetical protein
VGDGTPGPPREGLVQRLNHYHFRSVWTVAAEADAVFNTLAQLDTYPLWWPEVKAVTMLDADNARVQIRALLPYALEFLMARQVTDEAKGILRAGMTGDLEGFSCWTISSSQPGSRLVFEEDVVVNKLLLKMLAPVARPLFALNHTIMMNRGRRGLQRYLAGQRPAAGPAAEPA